MATQKDASKQSKKQVQRVYENTSEFIQDRFQLKTANMIKNMAPDGKEFRPHLVNVAHQHFFYSVDRKGRPQVKCTATGGHSHEITVKEVNGEFVAECGPPISINSKLVPEDRHTHDVMYLKSEKISQSIIKKKTQELVNFVSKEMEKGGANVQRENTELL